ncbi:glycosyltransferase [Winogradskyella sp.]|nr:glycosyltransferase [Winogradskyella sp.]
MSNILVSVCCLSYNHEPYIRQCLEGFMIQKTNFAFEVLIHDDASIDKTADIIQEYEEKYPNIIKPIYQTENQYSQGVKVTFKHNFSRAQGKYIALCEGDDYWTDPLKLQKQVDFLEANEDFFICHHAFDMKIMETGKIIPLPEKDNPSHQEYDITALALHNTIGTLTVMYRNHKDLVNDVVFKVTSGDYAMHLNNARFGKIKYIPEKMAIYRRHKESVTGNFNGAEGLIFKMGTLIPLIEADIFSDKVLYNLKQHLLKLYIGLYHHYDYIKDEKNKINTFEKLIKIVTSIIDENDFSEAIINVLLHHIRHNENNDFIQNIKIKKYRSILLKYDELSIFNSTILNSTSYKFGNRFVKLFSFLKQ